MHLVALDEALVVLPHCRRRSGELLDVFVQIPAQIFIEDCGQEVKLFVIVLLQRGKQKKLRNSTNETYVT